MNTGARVQIRKRCDGDLFADSVLMRRFTDDGVTFAKVFGWVKAPLFTLLALLMGCAPDAQALDSNDDFHCAMTFLHIENVVKAERASANAIASAHTMTVWFFNQIEEEELKSADHISAALAKNRADINRIAKLCVDRASTDPSFVKWSGPFHRNYLSSFK